MDYSIRSLNSKKATGKGARRGGADGMNDERMSLIMLNAHRIFDRKGKKPIHFNDLLNALAKMDITVPTKEELTSILMHYK